MDAVADRAGISKRDAGAVVDAFLDTITDALRSRDSVTFTGFGKFSTSARAARMGVNPRTGSKVSIPATTVAKFSAGSALKAMLSGRETSYAGLPGVFEPVDMPKYCCPEGDYEWFQHSVGVPVPECPAHFIPLRRC